MSHHAALPDAILNFAEFGNCYQLMIQLRWADGVIKCPRCNGEKLCWVEKQRRWKCYAGHPRSTFTLKTGTIFEDSPLPLEKWLPAVWMLLNCRNGISSYELHRSIGVTQKTAWFMLQRIRLSLQDDLAGGRREVYAGDLHFLRERAGGPMAEGYNDDGKRIESTEEFARFREGMKRILSVPKRKLDEKVLEMKAASERIGNAKAPGRKPRKPIHG